MKLKICFFYLLSFSLFGCTIKHIEDVPSSSQLDAIIKHGVLRVGTTGDYKPFTFFNSKTNSYEGIDIAMANDLANALGITVEFIKTTWPTLMNDFLSNKFDIAMGGISIDLKRQTTAFFSIPYYHGGKSAIALCSNQSHFLTLSMIDQPNIRIIVNPGGTNEKFVRENIKQAQIIVYPDNVTIFNQLISGAADVMITDSIETLLQQKQLPALCAIHPDHPFNFSEKAYLLPRGDAVFKEWIDQWLHDRIESGRFEKIYNQFLNKNTSQLNRGRGRGLAD